MIYIRNKFKNRIIKKANIKKEVTHNKQKKTNK